MDPQIIYGIEMIFCFHFDTFLELCFICLLELIMYTLCLFKLQF